MKISTVDRKILKALQVNADIQVTQLAEQVNLAVTSCWRHIQRLKEAGIITKQVAILDAKKINVGVTVFVSVKTSQHTPTWFETFREKVEAIPEIVEFYRMSGDIDYLLRIVVPDIAGYDAVYKRLIKGTNITDVSSSFALEELKFTAALPLDYAE